MDNILGDRWHIQKRNKIKQINCFTISCLFWPKRPLCIKDVCSCPWGRPSVLNHLSTNSKCPTRYFILYFLMATFGYFWSLWDRVLEFGSQCLRSYPPRPMCSITPVLTYNAMQLTEAMYQLFW